MNDKNFLATIQDLSTNSGEIPVILGAPKNGKRVTDLSHDLAATERVFTTKTE
jgi:hypothetical protein